MRLYLKNPKAQFLDHPVSEGSCPVVIIEDLGAGMTPSQVRQRLAEYEALDETDQVEIWITTSDIATINEFYWLGEFDEVYERVYCWNAGEWVPLTALHSSDWLGHFSLGDLYGRSQIG